MPKIRDLELLSDIDIIYNNKIALFGAGDYGKRALRLLGQLGISVVGFCDSKEEKWGNLIEGHKVFSLQELAQCFRDDHVIIIITIAMPSQVEEVLKTLDHYGMSEALCYTYFSLKFTVEFHLEDARIDQSFREELKTARKLYLDWLYSDRVNIIRQLLYSTKLYETILVLTPRKVGTTSVAKSIAKCAVHSIQTDRVCLGNWTKEKNPDRREVLGILHKEKKVKIISLIREPIARAISDYFYGMEISGYLRDYIPVGSDIYDGIRIFLEKETKIGNYGYVFDWFNTEIKDMFGIDIYQYPFDREKGYQIIYKDNIELLLLKMEKLDVCQDIIGKFVGAENFKLIRDNVGTEKLYKFAYTELKKTIKIPEPIIDFYYKENAAMDHFYTEKEKELFTEKWLEKIV